ncbi:diguanylate cyclase domain-containing protein [Halomonas alkalisoli]|uniref:diguanylate cyclase domain-containing protein n=1 Tax=Halomonas alkalisoli TaxID=2907158 RepID=UPI0034E2639E
MAQSGLTHPAGIPVRHAGLRRRHLDRRVPHRRGAVRQLTGRHGHDAGDSVLRQVAQTVQARLRASDHLGRWGGRLKTYRVRRFCSRFMAGVGARSFSKRRLAA